MCPPRRGQLLINCKERSGNMIEEDDKKLRRSFPKSSKLTVNMSETLYRRLSDYAEAHGRDMSEIIRACLDDYLTKNKK